MPASLLAALQPFAAIPAADQALLLRAWQCRSVAEGEFLSEAGGVCQELFFIQQGVLRLVAQPGPGREVTHSFRHEGQLCTVLTSFEKQVPTPLRIQAACPAQLLVISKTRLEALSQQLPYLAGLLADYAGHTLREKLHAQRAYLGQDAAGRYDTFLRLQPEVARRVPQRMVAAYLGITPQSLSRLRRTLAGG